MYAVPALYWNFSHSGLDGSTTPKRIMLVTLCADGFLAPDNLVQDAGGIQVVLGALGEVAAVITGRTGKSVKCRFGDKAEPLKVTDAREFFMDPVNAEHVVSDVLAQFVFNPVGGSTGALWNQSHFDEIGRAEAARMVRAGVSGSTLKSQANYFNQCVALVPTGFSVLWSGELKSASQFPVPVVKHLASAAVTQLCAHLKYLAVSPRPVPAKKPTKKKRRPTTKKPNVK